MLTLHRACAARQNTNVAEAAERRIRFDDDDNSNDDDCSDDGQHTKSRAISILSM
jgi:hypothetical protein